MYQNLTEAAVPGNRAHVTLWPTVDDPGPGINAIFCVL